MFIVQQCHGGELSGEYWKWRRKEANQSRWDEHEEFRVQQEEELARFQAALPYVTNLANLDVQGVMAINPGSDAIAAVIDIQQNGLDWTHFLAAASWLPVGLSNAPPVVVRMGDCSIEITSELADKLKLLSNDALKRLSDRLAQAKSSDEAAQLLESELRAIENAPNSSMRRLFANTSETGTTTLRQVKVQQTSGEMSGTQLSGVPTTLHSPAITKVSILSCRRSSSCFVS